MRPTHGWCCSDRSLSASVTFTAGKRARLYPVAALKSIFMARDVFFSKQIEAIASDAPIEATIQYNEGLFGTTIDDVSPWTVSIHRGHADLGRIVGFEGAGQQIIGMHGLRPDMTAKRGAEITVFRVNDDLRTHQLDAAVLTAFERWLLKRGWRGNVLKKIRPQSTKSGDPFAQCFAGLTVFDIAS